MEATYVKRCRCGGALVELVQGDDVPATCGAPECGAAIVRATRDEEREIAPRRRQRATA
jgi:hypothetical protein